MRVVKLDPYIEFAKVVEYSLNVPYASEWTLEIAARWVMLPILEGQSRLVIEDGKIAMWFAWAGLTDEELETYKSVPESWLPEYGKIKVSAERPNVLVTDLLSVNTAFAKKRLILEQEIVAATGVSEVWGRRHNNGIRRIGRYCRRFI